MKGKQKKQNTTLNIGIHTSFARHKLEIIFCAIIHFIRFPQFKRVGRIFEVFRVLYQESSRIFVKKEVIEFFTVKLLWKFC